MGRGPAGYGICAASFDNPLLGPGALSSGVSAGGAGAAATPPWGAAGVLRATVPEGRDPGRDRVYAATAGHRARWRGATRQAARGVPATAASGQRRRPFRGEGRQLCLPFLRFRPQGAPLQEMVIYGVSFDMVGKQPIVLLKAVDTNKFLPIWIGHPEAAAILMKLQGATTPRPMTHDLLFEMLGELEVACTRVSVTELRENTFYASITLSVNGREVEIDSRPSDALALAVRSGAPIFAAEDVIAESAIEFEHEVEDTEEVVDKFKEFLDRVTPEDFAGGDD